MEDTIKVEIRSHYGKQHFYPKCSNGKLFSEIAETKTLTLEVLKRITKMGFQIEVVNQTTIEGL